LIDLANDAPTAARRVNLSSLSARALALERFATQQQLTTSDPGGPVDRKRADMIRRVIRASLSDSVPVRMS
jgi:hypothetical protein